MTAWQTYWLFTLDGIKEWTAAPAIICLLIIIASMIAVTAPAIVQEEEACEAVFKWNCRYWPWLIPTLLVFSLLSTLIPSTKTMAAIIVLPRIASADNLDTVSKDAGDIYKLAMVRLKDAIGEPEAKEASK